MLGGRSAQLVWAIQCVEGRLFVHGGGGGLARCPVVQACVVWPSLCPHPPPSYVLPAFVSPLQEWSDATTEALEDGELSLQMTGRVMEFDASGMQDTMPDVLSSLSTHHRVPCVRCALLEGVGGGVFEPHSPVLTLASLTIAFERHKPTFSCAPACWTFDDACWACCCLLPLVTACCCLLQATWW